LKKGLELDINLMIIVHSAYRIRNSNFLTLNVLYDNFSKDNNDLKIIPSQKNLPIPTGDEHDR